MLCIRLPDAARRALNELAERERREPREQATLIIIRSLKRRGLLRDEDLEPPSADPPAQKPVVTVVRAPGGERDN